MNDLPEILGRAKAQRHALTRDELARIIARLEEETRQRYGVEVKIEDHPAEDGVQFAYALNLSICIGCRRCTPMR